VDRFSALQSYGAESARFTLARGWDRSKQPDAPIRLLGASQQPGRTPGAVASLNTSEKGVGPVRRLPVQ